MVNGTWIFERMKRFEITATVVWATAAVLTLAYLVLALLSFPPICGWDVMVRYAPMAEAFAAGDWADAFHPRFCLLYPMLTGSVAKTVGCSGLVACQVTAILFWGLSFPALWAVLRRVFDDTVAYVGSLFLFISVDLFVLAVDGWRDDCRILPIALMALSFQYLARCCETDRPWKGAVAMAAAQLLSVPLRVDCLVIASVMLVVYVAACLRYKCLSAAIAPIIAWIVAALANCVLVYACTGWFLPAPHLIRIMEAFAAK